MSASSWQHLPVTAQLYLHRMMKAILSSPAWRGGSTEASFRTVFSLTRAGQSMIVIFCGEGFLSRRKLRESARITRFFRLTPQEIRHPMFRSQSSVIRERPAPITLDILARASPSGSARIDPTDSGAEKGMVSLLLMRPSFASLSPVSGGFFGVALILMANGAPDSAKPWHVRSLPAVLRERALARPRTSLIAVPPAAETGPQR